jgi:hypothetical protein
MGVYSRLSKGCALVRFTYASSTLGYFRAVPLALNTRAPTCKRLPYNPDGMPLKKPRVEGHERRECRATLGFVPNQKQNSNGVALTNQPRK